MLWTERQTPPVTVATGQTRKRIEALTRHANRWRFYATDQICLSESAQNSKKWSAGLQTHTSAPLKSRDRGPKSGGSGSLAATRQAHKAASGSSGVCDCAVCFLSKKDQGEQSDGLFDEALRRCERVGARSLGRATSPMERRIAEPKGPAVSERRTPAWWV